MRAWALALPMLAGLAGPASAGPVLDRIGHLKTLVCGALDPPADYSRDDTHGSVLPLATAYCRAVGVAILGEQPGVKIVALPDEKHGFAAVQSGAIDLLVGASAHYPAARSFGLAFAPPLFMDGQSYLVNRASGIATVANLQGRHLCFLGGTESETATEAVLQRRHITYLPFPQQEEGEMQAALVTGHCTAMAGSITQLADARTEFKALRQDFVILPDPITLDPIRPAYAAADPQFGAIVTATTAMLLLAEEAGLTQRDAASPAASEDPDLRLLTGIDPTVALALGLRRGWALQMIQAVGNYAELFDRTLGQHSDLHLARGASALWRDGGALYPLLP
jgi:general L-amino acid transport system substrate-binding protein